jgi:hypothetical protein
MCVWTGPKFRDNRIRKLLDSDPVLAACEVAVHDFGLALAEQGGPKLLETVLEEVSNRVEDIGSLVLIWFPLRYPA